MSGASNGRHAARRIAAAAPRIEQQAALLRDRPWGVVLLLSITMDMQQRNRSLSTILDGRHELLVGLGERTAAAFAPRVHTARAAGVVRPGVTVRDLLLAMQMVTVAFTEGDPRTSAKTFRRAKAMLFTTGIDGISS